MRPTPLPCPACNSMLRGSPLAGSRCVRCHAYYSTRHVRTMRRAHFGALIAQHFSHVQKAAGVPRPKESLSRHRTEDIQSDIIVEDTKQEVVRALVEAREAASEASKHLEDVVGGVEKITEDREALVDAVKALPQLRHEQRTSAYQSRIGSSPMRKKIARKKPAKRIVKTRPKKRTTKVTQKKTRTKPAKKRKRA